jgi:integrase
MPRPPGVQITRDRRKDGSITFALRVRIAGADERVSLGNTTDSWDEIRAEQARKQLLAKIELGLWTPGKGKASEPYGDEEPTFRELATDCLEARKRNPAIRPRTIELNESQLKRYLAPFFGELRASEITIVKIKQYREQIHRENAQIRDAAKTSRPLRDRQSGLRLRTLSNDSINKTLRTLALILDEAEDAGWIERNVARGRRTREPLERRPNRAALDVDEFLALIEAADQLDNRHRPRTLERASQVRVLRDDARLDWKRIAAHVGVAPTTAMYLYECNANADGPICGLRRAIIATLALAGPRVGEFCNLDNQDISLAKARFHIRDAKTDAGVRSVDIHPRLLDELTAYRASRATAAMDAPAFPTRAGTRRDRNNILSRVVQPVLARANELRTGRGEPPILVHVTPHTFRRTYITFMVVAGYDLPYIQAQVGHMNPTTTLAIYAQLMRRSDREQLRTEIRKLLGVETERASGAEGSSHQISPSQPGAARLRATEKAGKGRALHP